MSVHPCRFRHVQVSCSNDDSFEWFGGSVNCKHLVAYHGWDDDFDTDNGFSGNVQYGLSIRNARIADKSQSNGFESDNNASGSDASPFTTATFSNITFVGPKMQTGENLENTTDFINAGSYNPNNGSALGRFQSAMQVRRSSRLNIIQFPGFRMAHRPDSRRREGRYARTGQEWRSAFPPQCDGGHGHSRLRCQQGL